MARSRHYGARPPGDLQVITEAWKQRVREKLEALGKSEQWLADQLAERLGRPGMKRDTVNKLMRRQKQSVLVPDITAILGIEDETQRAIDLILKASPVRIRALIALLEDDSES